MAVKRFVSLTSPPGKQWCCQDKYHLDYWSDRFSIQCKKSKQQGLLSILLLCKYNLSSSENLFLLSLSDWDLGQVVLPPVRAGGTAQSGHHSLLRLLRSHPLPLSRAGKTQHPGGDDRNNLQDVMMTGADRLVCVVCEDPQELSPLDIVAGVWRSLTTETVLETILYAILYSVLCLWRWCWQQSPLEILSGDRNIPTLFILTEVWIL